MASLAASLLVPASLSAAWRAAVAAIMRSWWSAECRDTRTRRYPALPEKCRTWNCRRPAAPLGSLDECPNAQIQQDLALHWVFPCAPLSKIALCCHGVLRSAATRGPDETLHFLRFARHAPVTVLLHFEGSRGVPQYGDPTKPRSSMMLPNTQQLPLLPIWLVWRNTLARRCSKISSSLGVAVRALPRLCCDIGGGAAVRPDAQIRRDLSPSMGAASRETVDAFLRQAGCPDARVQRYLALLGCDRARNCCRVPAPLGVWVSTPTR